MSVVTVTNQGREEQYKKPGILKNTAGVGAGFLVPGFVNAPFQRVIAPKLMENVQKLNIFNEHEADEFRKGAEKALKQTGLADKGVEFLRVTEENVTQAAQYIADEFKFLPKSVREFLGGMHSQAIKAGKNAMFEPVSNKMLLPGKGLEMCVFHEMGHAANKNLSMIGKVLQKSRPLTALTLPIALIGLFKTKKAPGEKSKGFMDRATDFVKNNAGKLTLLTFVPVLIEEAMASINGEKFAKQVLRSELVKKMSKANKVAYLTYAGMATATSVGVALAVKVRDKIAGPKLVKQEN